MAQIFHPSTNTIARVSIFGIVILLGAMLWLVAAISRSSYVTQAGVVREQPVPFSHKHHVSGLGIDCRYCHAAVEESSFAGMPTTKTCMTCHAQIWADAPMLEPVRQSLRTNRSIAWVRVQRPARFRLLQPQHSPGQRDWLRELPWPSRRDATDVAGALVGYGMVPGVSPAAGTFSQTPSICVQYALGATRRPTHLGTETGAGI